MMDAELISLLKTVSVVFGVAVTMAGGYFAYTRNTRESHNQAITEANTTIAMLEKQNTYLEKQIELLEQQRKDSTEAWQKREGEWLKVEAKLERRITDVERDYRNLVLTVTTMGFCANANTCVEYNPGDRRTHDLGGKTDG